MIGGYFDQVVFVYCSSTLFIKSRRCHVWLSNIAYILVIQIFIHTVVPGFAELGKVPDRLLFANGRFVVVKSIMVNCDPG